LTGLILKLKLQDLRKKEKTLNPAQRKVKKVQKKVKKAKRQIKSQFMLSLHHLKLKKRGSLFALILLDKTEN
jgi:hypothetical protein